MGAQWKGGTGNNKNNITKYINTQYLNWFSELHMNTYSIGVM